MAHMVGGSWIGSGGSDYKEPDRCTGARFCPKVPDGTRACRKRKRVIAFVAGARLQVSCRHGADAGQAYRQLGTLLAYNLAALYAGA